MKIYKVCGQSHWQKAQEDGVFTGVAIDLSDGFIHFSAADQLAETLEKHFTGQTDLVLLTIDAEAIAKDLKWEPSRGGALFPHLYADLPLNAITNEHQLQSDDAGKFILPESL